MISPTAAYQRQFIRHYLSERADAFFPVELLSGEEKETSVPPV
jgi:hypothetical protein